MNTNDPALWQSILAALVFLGALVLVYQNRKRIAGINTPFIDAIITKSVFWLIGFAILSAVASAFGAALGWNVRISILPAEALMQICIGFAAVKWAMKQ